jgi:hypothetical protein
MGRWGDELYQSDTVGDFHNAFIRQIEREVAYSISPEQIQHDSGWIAHTITLLELILLFEQNDMNGGLTRDEQKVKRWCEIFFSVWDSDWEEKPKGYGNSVYDTREYRKQHRTAIVEKFDYLQGIAHYWTELFNDNTNAKLESLPQDYPLPHYSIKRWMTEDGKEMIEVEHFVVELMEYLEREIIYWLSPEKRAEAITFDVEEVWVSVHLLGFLSEKYEQSPGVNERVVRKWRDTTIEIWKEFLNDDRIKWDEPKGLYLNVLGVFDKLEAMAKKYPPYDWSYGDDAS